VRLPLFAPLAIEFDCAAVVAGLATVVEAATFEGSVVESDGDDCIVGLYVGLPFANVLARLNPPEAYPGVDVCCWVFIPDCGVRKEFKFGNCMIL